MNLQPTKVSYTVSERASGLYRITTDVFNWDKSSDCVTPLELAQKQFESCDVDGTVCIPGAGIGTYVVAALQAGFEPESITAVEFNPAYHELGSAIYRRFGVNYVLADFTEWQPEMKFDVIVGNPPYGKNASLAVKFLNKAAEYSDHISFVLPRTFRKPSVLNRIDEHLHLVEDVDTPNETFGGTIITCRQKWEKREEKRERIRTYTQHPDLNFVSKAESNVFVGRVGAASGKVLTEGYGHYTEQHYFLRASEEVVSNLKQVESTLRELGVAATVGTPSLSKHELISTYVDRFG
jgi:predicted RNA methylase